MYSRICPHFFTLIVCGSFTGVRSDAVRPNIYAAQIQENDRWYNIKHAQITVAMIHDCRAKLSKGRLRNDCSWWLKWQALLMDIHLLMSSSDSLWLACQRGQRYGHSWWTAPYYRTHLIFTLDTQRLYIYIWESSPRQIIEVTLINALTTMHPVCPKSIMLFVR